MWFVILLLVSCAPLAADPFAMQAQGARLQSAASAAIAATDAAGRQTQVAHVQAYENTAAAMQVQQTQAALRATNEALVFQAEQTHAAATAISQATTDAAERMATMDAATATAQVVQATATQGAYLALLESSERQERTRQTLVAVLGIGALLMLWVLIRWWFIPLLQIKVDERQRKSEVMAINGRTYIYLVPLGAWVPDSEISRTFRLTDLLPPNTPPVVEHRSQGYRLIEAAIEYWQGDGTQTEIPSWRRLGWGGGTWQAAIDELKDAHLAVVSSEGSRCADGYTLADVKERL
jgi:hypothetical protein